MSETTLRNLFLIGTVVFLIVLVGMTADTLSKVRKGRTPAVTAEVAAGKGVWQSRDCDDCHTILGIGAYFAPDLTKLLDRRDPVWVHRWLMDPQAVKPATTMPNQRLSAVEADRLVAFFQWMRAVDTNGWPPAPVGAVAAAGSPAASMPGALLLDQKGCLSCHVVNGRGVKGDAPDLSRIGGQPYDGLPNTAEFLESWLKDPSAQKPGTAMPSIPMTDDQREEIVRYLLTLR